MKSFKEYSKQTSTDETAKERQSKQTETVAEDLTKRIAEAYNGRSNADMMQNILMEAEKSKRAGTLSNEEIEAFYQNFSPMLNVVKRKKLRIIVDRLKQI